MTAKPSVYRIALPALLLLSFLLLPSLAFPQVAIDYCEPSATTKAELKKVANVHEDPLPFSARLEKQRTMLQELVSKHPNDFHLQRRYQDSRRAGFYYDAEALLADYRAQMEKKPNDSLAARTSLFSRSTSMRRSASSSRS